MDRLFPRHWWGMSPVQVIGVEGAPHHVMPDGNFSYNAEFIGGDATIFFMFARGGLVRVMAGCPDATPSDDLEWMIGLIATMKGILGPGSQFSAANGVDLNPDDQLQVRAALISGRLALEHRWWSNDSLVRVRWNPTVAPGKATFLLENAVGEDGMLVYPVPLAGMMSTPSHSGPPAKREVDHRTRITSAMAAGENLFIRYRDRDGAVTARLVRPSSWVDAVHFTAHCFYRGAGRTFRLGRIESIE